MNQWDQQYMQPAQEVRQCLFCPNEVEEGYFCSKDCAKAYEED